MWRIDYKDAAPTGLCALRAEVDPGNASQLEMSTPLYDALFREHRTDVLRIALVSVTPMAVRVWMRYFPRAGFVVTDVPAGPIFDSEWDDALRLLPDGGHERFDLVFVGLGGSSVPGLLQTWLPQLTPGGLLVQQQEPAAAPPSSPPPTFRVRLLRPPQQDVSLHVGAGADLRFGNRRQVTVITPSMRPGNVRRVAESLDMAAVKQWVIVYDGKHVRANPWVFKGAHPKITEVVFAGEGKSGNPQRNFALDSVLGPHGAAAADTFLYYLDDDNVAHPDLFTFLRTFANEGYLYTFNQAGGKLKGDAPALDRIDTGMVLLDGALVAGLTWDPDKYNADGVYILQCLDRAGPRRWVYIDKALCTYNVLPGPGPGSQLPTRRRGRA